MKLLLTSLLLIVLVTVGFEVSAGESGGFNAPIETGSSWPADEDPNKYTVAEWKSIAVGFRYLAEEYKDLVTETNSALDDYIELANMSEEHIISYVNDYNHMLKYAKHCSAALEGGPVWTEDEQEQWKDDLKLLDKRNEETGAAIKEMVALMTAKYIAPPRGGID